MRDQLKLEKKKDDLQWKHDELQAQLCIAKHALLQQKELVVRAEAHQA